jgi:hypothetical protein
MQISWPTYFLIVWAIGFSLAVALFIVDDRIVEHVCRKERRKYSSVDSWFGLYWFLRKLSPSWFREAREAGYLKARIILVAMFICFLIGTSILSRSGLVPEMPRRTTADCSDRDPGSALCAVRDDACGVT